MATTKLDAVNTMLGCIGEAPVADIESTSNVDIVTALKTLDEVSRKVQGKGWYCNTIPRTTLSLDINGNIPIGSNVIAIFPMDTSADVDAEVRGDRLFNLEDNSFVFESALVASLIVELTWDELPEQLRHYIMIKAARVLVQRSLGDGVEARYTAADESEAMTEWKRYNRKRKKLSLYRGSNYNLNISRRRPL